MPQYEKTAKEILAENEPLFRFRQDNLLPLARENPERHPPAKRTWWDWKVLQEQYDVAMNDRDQCATLLRAVRLAPDLETCEEILRSGRVPKSRLDPYWAKRYGVG